MLDPGIAVERLKLLNVGFIYDLMVIISNYNMDIDWSLSYCI